MTITTRSTDRTETKHTKRIESKQIEIQIGKCQRQQSKCPNRMNAFHLFVRLMVARIFRFALLHHFSLDLVSFIWAFRAIWLILIVDETLFSYRLLSFVAGFLIIIAVICWFTII